MIEEDKPKPPPPAIMWEPNPLRRHRNIPCPCGSSEKVKNCHGRFEFIPAQDAFQVRRYLRELSASGFIEARPWEIK